MRTVKLRGRRVGRVLLLTEISLALVEESDRVTARELG